MTRILIVDDHEVVRRGVRALLSAESDFTVCGEAVDGRDGVQKARELRPDVVVMDISMPHVNGLEATRLIRSELPGIEVLILTQHDAPEMLHEAFNAGARGYVTKSAIAENLAAAVDTVSRHETFMPEMRGASANLDVQELLHRSAILEQALRETEERFRATFEQAAVGIGHVAPDGRWIRVNRKLCEITGYTAEELSRMTFQEITHPDDLRAHLEKAKKLTDGEIDSYSIEKRYIRKDGSVVWINVTASSSRDAAGKFKHFISVVEDISARKQADQRLQVTLERLALAQVAGKSGTFEWKIQDNRNTWSPEIERLYGLQPGTFGGTFEHFLDFIPPEDRQSVNDLLQSAFKTGTLDGQFHIRRADGALRRMRAQGKVFFDAEGRPEQLIGINVDLTDTWDTEQASARLAAIVDSSDDVIVSKDLQGIIKSWNGAAERLFGYSAAETVGRPITIIIPPELHNEEANILARVRRGERIDHFETVRVTKSGRRLDVSLTISPIKDAAGNITGASKILRDVTDRKLTELALYEKENLLRGAFAQTYSFLALVSPDGTVIEANRAALEGTGYQRHEVIGKKIWETWWGNLPEEQPALKRSLANAAEGLSVREECSYAIRDGSIRFADRSFNPVFNDKGELVIIVASGLDITEQRLTRSMLEERVAERTRELEQKNNELIKQADVVRELSGRLLQIQDEERRRIARELHDSIGQMLAAVSMNTSHASRESQALSPSAAAALKENATLLDQISGEIRTISHLLHPPLLDEIGLQSAIQWYIDGFSGRSKINIALELPDDFGRLPRESELTLFRVVQECLTNIHRHSGSRTASVRISRSADHVTLEVSDKGRGIPDDLQLTISSGRLAGVGLRGMRERLRQLGGQLRVESNSSGTHIVAQLPVHESGVEAVASSAASSS